MLGYICTRLGMVLNTWRNSPWNFRNSSAKLTEIPFKEASGPFKKCVQIHFLKYRCSHPKLRTNRLKKWGRGANISVFTRSAFCISPLSRIVRLRVFRAFLHLKPSQVEIGPRNGQGCLRKRRLSTQQISKLQRVPHEMPVLMFPHVSFQLSGFAASAGELENFSCERVWKF